MSIEHLFKRGDRFVKTAGPHAGMRGVVTATRFVGHSVYVRFDGEPQPRKGRIPWALVGHLWPEKTGSETK